MLLDLATREVRALTTNGAVNVEPRWSPDGTPPRLRLDRRNRPLPAPRRRRSRRAGWESRRRSCRPPQQRSPATTTVAFDHAINPTWTRDGKRLLFVVQPRYRPRHRRHRPAAADGCGVAALLHHEETSWHARPDVSPDGTRIVYSSYHGRQWQQLWLLPVDGGYPFPLTYGDYDNTSPAGRLTAGRSRSFPIAPATQPSGSSMRVGRATSCRSARSAAILQPHRELTLDVVDEAGRPLPARISITDSRGRAYAPDAAWVHADDMLVPERQTIETRYFHSTGRSRGRGAGRRVSSSLSVTGRPTRSRASTRIRGRRLVAYARRSRSRACRPRQIRAREWSGDLHVHMNYGGRIATRRAPCRAGARRRSRRDLQPDRQQGAAVSGHRELPPRSRSRVERSPPDSARTGIPHQLLGTSRHPATSQHLLLPGLRRLPVDGRWPVPYPHNARGRRHGPRSSMGWSATRIRSTRTSIPRQAGRSPTRCRSTSRWATSTTIEAVGFSDHKVTAAVWYRLLDCRLPSCPPAPAPTRWRTTRACADRSA